MKPRMQLSPGEYVTDAFRAEMNAWLIDFFGYEEDQNTAVKPTFNDANLTTAKLNTKPVRKRRSKTQVQPDTKTFSGLLEGLQDSFRTMQVPPITGSWLSRKDLSAIKKLGIYVPNELTLEVPDVPIVDAAVRKTAIASAYFVQSKHDECDKMYPRFVFCIKAMKLPECVEATRGTPYQFGLCFEMKHEENGQAMKPKTFWAWCWMVITSTGEVRIPHERRQMSIPIQHKRSVSGYKGQRGARSSTAFTRQWCLPTMAVAEAGFEQSGYEHYLKCTFRQLLMWWHQRDSQWSVGVRKDGNRVAFSIAKEHTSAYFADRETTVNVEGKPRKIIHFVREHERANGSVVREHVRGLREFDWKGYHCVVTAPKLNGSITTNCPVAPVELEKTESMDGMMSTTDLASWLADLEDAK